MSFERTRRSVIASIIALGLISVMTFGYVGTLDYAQDRTRALLKSVEASTGLQIKINEHQFSTSGARFDNIVLGDGDLGKIGSILADLSVNPFSSQFGTIKKVRIQDLEVETDVAELNTILRQQLNAKKAEARGNKKNKRRIPQDIVVNNANVRVNGKNQEPLLSLEDVNARYVHKTGRLIFRAASIHLRGEQLTGEVSGQIDVLDTLSYLPFSIESEEAQSSWQVSGKIKRDFSGVNLATSFRGLRGPLANYVRTIVPNPEGLEGGFSATFAIDHARQQMRYLANADIKRGAFFHPIIASQPFALPMRLKARGSVGLDATQFKVEDGFVAVRGPIAENNPAQTDKLKVWFNINQQPAPKNTIDIAVNIPATSCQSALDAIPVATGGALKNFTMGGDFQFAANLSVDPQALEKFTFDVSDYAWNCQAVKAPFDYSRDRLAQAFTFVNPYEGSNAGRLIGTKESNPVYTALPQISENVKLALLGAEDLNFWAHNGFESGQIINALRENLKQRRVAIGGSTISMQTAKNLFLNRERTLARKGQEAFLTWHLERSLPKERILEIYLNIIEFGPGIYGITQAARHYFNKLPSELSLVESTYLISTLPSPVHRYNNFCNGKVSANYQEMLDKRLDRMVKFDLITDNERQHAKRERLQFSNAQLYSKESCLEKIARLTQSVKLR